MIFAAAFVYVLPEATELIDDHFMHVAWGRQLLYGRWFIRDMAVLGLPLQSALSAAFEWAVGYRLLSAKRVDDAIVVFELNTELYPSSWNAWDSLAEGHMTAGHRDLAIKFYEKSLELNPKNAGGRTALEKLRAGH